MCFLGPSVQSTQFCSLLFYCIVAVLINRIFIHSLNTRACSGGWHRHSDVFLQGNSSDAVPGYRYCSNLLDLAKHMIVCKVND